MMTDREVARRWQELRYRMFEISVDPDHPASRANGARWKREYKAIEAEATRRGLFTKEEKHAGDR